jgi:transcriptional regulator with GAF, ATPase, and Fis domain
MTLCTRGDDACDHPGLVFFERVTDELCDWLGEAAKEGRAPIYAVGVAAGFRCETGVWRVLGAGAADVLAWACVNDFASVISARLRRWRETQSLLQSVYVQGRLVGQSRAWTAVLRQVVEVARFTQDAVLITGESGTGKELIAGLIHDLDARSDKGRLVIVDCTTLTAELAGSELFGHERGAFTGALNAREGALALADGGTLFLDEIGELPLPLQAQLLRAIQERTYKRVGSNAWQSSRFRLVCATNRDLEAEVAQGAFRGDLFYRIAGCVFCTPPLRERTEDILPLAEHFLTEADPRRSPPAIDDAVRDYLLAREYPGNVRDLRRVVFRLAHRHAGPGPITAGDVPEAERPRAEPPHDVWPDQRFDCAIREAVDLGIGLKELGQVVAQLAIRVALEKEQGNLQRAARRLGVTDRALQMRRAIERSSR